MLLAKFLLLSSFFAPWCGHCKSLAPEYEIVGTTFAKYSSKVAVAKIDCDAESEVCQNNGVSGYPTLKWFSADGTAESYSGGRTANDIISFINSKTGLKAGPTKAPSNVVDLTNDNFDEKVLETVDKFALVEFFAPWCGHCKTLAPVYEKLANVFVNEPSVIIAKVDATQEADLAKKYSVSGYPTLKFFTSGNADPEDYSGGRDLSSLVSFLNEKAGTHRTDTGRLDQEAGKEPELAAIVGEFLASDEKDALLEQATVIAAQLEPSAQFYIRVMQKVIKDGNDYVEKEIKRLNRMIENPAVNEKKRDEFTIRVNILSSFSTTE